MKRVSCGKALLVVAAVTVFTLFALAQNDRGSITGTVSDPSGAAVKGAAVKVTHVETGITFDATTNDDGRFVVPSILKVGVYRVEASQTGFKTAVSHDVELRIGDVRQVDLTLTVGSQGEKVTVTAEAPLLNTETSARGDVIEGRQVTELPLRDRNFTNLALLTPGVNRAFTAVVTDSFVFNQGDPNAGGNGLTDSRGDTPAARFARSGGSAIIANGLRPGNNNFTLDGVDNNEPIYGEIGVFPNPDAIQEFRVETSLAKAEAGRGGAQINTSIKSGSNSLHGSVSYYGQNAALNAVSPGIGFRRAHDGAVLPKTATHINEFGFTVGGPIIKNRTFFFGDYLGQRNSIPNEFHTAVPTQGARDGDFSAFSVQLVDPGTDTNGFGFPAGTPFPGNIIPNLTSRSDFSPIAQKVFKLFPLPTKQGVTDPSRDPTPNYIGTRKFTERIDSFDVKIDHKLTNSNNLNFRYTRDNQKSVRSNFFPGNLPTAGFGAGDELGNTRQIVATDTHVFTPNLLNEVRFGYTKVEIGIQNCGVEGACGVSASWCTDLGIPNCNKGTAATTGGPLLGWGGGNPPGELEFLGDGGLFQQSSKNFYVADSITFIHGKHTWKGGVEVRPRIIDQLDSGNFGFLKGAMAWGNGGVCGVGCVNSGHTGVNQADTLLSVSADFSQSGTVGGGDKPFTLRNVEYSLFIQDDWKATSNLTLNLGLRWDVLPLYHESNNRIGNFDPVALTLNRAKGGNALVDTNYKNFGPRVGFAYSYGSSRQYVFRGGYGLFYALEGFGNTYPLEVNPPNVNQTFAGGATFELGPPVATVTDPPDLSTGTQLFAIPRTNYKNEQIHEWNLSWQAQFLKSFVFDLGYAANRSRHLLAERELGTNGNGLGGLVVNDNSFNCEEPPCRFNSVRAFESRASANYDSLQAKLEKRFSYGLVGTAAYTWSHNIDNNTGLFGNPGDLRGSQGGPINPLSSRTDRSNSALDHRHTFVGSFLYDLPFGKGKRYGSGVSSGADKIIGGWQWNTVLTATTGQHFSVTGDGTGSGGATIVNIIGDPFANREPGQFLNVNAFQQPLISHPLTACVTNLAGKDVCWGNSGRNHFTGPGYFRTDMSFFKNVHFTESVSLQIGIEAFNIFNQNNALVPQNNVGNLENLQPNGSFGLFTDTYLPPRIMQYRIKILF